LPNLSFGQSSQTEWEAYLGHQWIIQPFAQAVGMADTECSSGKLIHLQAGGKLQTESCQDGQRRQSRGNWQVSEVEDGLWSLELEGVRYQISQEEIPSRIRLTLTNETGRQLVIYRRLEMQDVPVPEGEDTP
ncbi:MAG: hypothetical protein AAGM67_10385, partial [Bacteroidota bacterium]